MPTLAATDKLYADYVNPQWMRLLDVLQMNVPYIRCEGAELFRVDGQRVSAPPLVVTAGQIDEFVSKLGKVVESIHSSTTFWSEALGWPGAW